MNPTEPGPDSHLDPARFDQLIEQIGPASALVVIQSWMGPRVLSRVSAEDIWQESLCIAWRDRARHEWRGVRAYRAWLLEIARMRIIDIARNLQTERQGGGRGELQISMFHDGVDASGARLGDFLPPGSSTPSRVVVHRERAAVFAQALRSLPSELEPVVRFYLFEELTMEEIAEKLQIGLSAAWYRFRKGVQLYTRAIGPALSSELRIQAAEL